MSATASQQIATLCDRCCVTVDESVEFDLDKLRLRGARLLIDKVAAVGSSTDHVVNAELDLIAPAYSERVRRTYGIEGRVLAIGPDVPSEIAVGDRVVIDEFAGRPIWWNDRLLPYWIVGIDEVMVALGDCE